MVYLGVEELESFEQILKMYLLHSWRRLEGGMSITKGYEHSLSAWGWERITKCYTPGLVVFEGFLLTTCFWEQGLSFHDKTPFRLSPKLCYGLGCGNYILCLNALMFIWNGYMQVCLMLCSLKIIKLHNWIIKLCQSTRGCPWVSFSECGSPSLTKQLSIMHSGHLWVVSRISFGFSYTSLWKYPNFLANPIILFSFQM